ncbi:Hemolysin activation/secretion protein [Desulfuromusa kysingii]|uniref:Hemolysin activation/secretion protein n=1 Tax=Desulfuromusa kysingii TaxID=37625 RepID=A0A1H4AH05_9BACT|nr:ShlB/FhaC/HecB family hemolysin secretion/activation protein [Desulfuromusa kysingii]SEA35166.1 Hemolysin activation/secretion protein [Desulfuromusa kysingii]
MMYKTLLLLILSLLAAFPAIAQTPPDAGRTLQELREPPQLRPPDQGLVITPQATAAAAPGGPKVELRQITFHGHSCFNDEQLAAVISDSLGDQYDLAGLRNIAGQITRYYQSNGYPFARAFLPAQSMNDGTLQIDIVEGRYGQFIVQGDEDVITPVKAWLQPLQTGEVISSDQLERVTLLLSDQPGISTAPLIRPGQELGTGDLQVNIEPDARFDGEVGADNYGSRTTGEYRGRFDLNINRPFSFGDQLQLRSIISNENLLTGSLQYNRPLGAKGMRGQIGYAHTDFEVGKEFSNLDATGKAQVGSLGLSYPLIRSQKTNLRLAAVYQHKRLEDKIGLTHNTTRRSSNSIPFSLFFDHRDGLAGSGISYGSISWTVGRVTFKENVNNSPEGSFQKINLDIARIQQLTSKSSLFARVVAQKSNSNLDSSEDFGVGGIYGVRAYSSGEGYGDQGILAQLELRYRIRTLTPYLFYDLGHVRIDKSNAHPANHRRIEGAGLGLRGEYKNLYTHVAVAWRTKGGASLTDSKDRNPRLWATLGYRF